MLHRVATLQTAFEAGRALAGIRSNTSALSDSVTAYAAWGPRDGSDNALINSSTLINDVGDISSSARSSTRSGPQQSGEVGLKGKFQTGPVGHAWTLATTRFTSDNSFNDARVGIPGTTHFDNLDFGDTPTFPGYGVTTSQTRATLGSYALADTLSFADDRVQWTVGARRQRVENTTENFGDWASKVSYDESRVSPATALLVKVTDKVSLYGNHIEGLSQGATAPDTAANRGAVMQPYQTKQYEVGAKVDLGTFAHTASLFQIEKPSAFTNPATNIFGVYGEQRNRGVEWSFFGEPLPRLRLMGGATYTQAEMTKVVAGGVKGEQVTGVPKVIAKLGTEYDLLDVPGLTLTGNVNHTGKQYATNDHRVSLDAYTTYDVGARYAFKVETKPVTLRATVQNVTNKAYWLGSWNGGDGSGLSGGLGAPRTLLVSGTVDF